MKNTNPVPKGTTNPKPKPKPTQPKANINNKTGQTPAHDTTKDNNKNASYWSAKPIACIVDQLRQHHKVRIQAEDLKGPKKKYAKADLLKLMKNKLEIT